MKKVLYLMLTVFCVVCLSGCGKKYTVTFDTDGGTKVEEIKVKKNATIEVLPTTTKEGYTFIEWQLDGKTYNFNSTVTKNITLKATWKKIEETKPVEEIKYTVSFDSNGGSSVASQTVLKGNKVTKPVDPTKSGYTFIGWTLNGDSYDFNTPVNGDITLKANWKEVKDSKQNITEKVSNVYFTNQDFLGLNDYYYYYLKITWNQV